MATIAGQDALDATGARKPLYAHLYVQVLVAILVGVVLGTLDPARAEAMKPLRA